MLMAAPLGCLRLTQYHRKQGSALIQPRLVRTEYLLQKGIATPFHGRVQ